MDEPPVRAENFLPILSLVVPLIKDDRLSAAQRQLGQGILVGHASSQAQSILKSFFLRSIMPEARSSGSRPPHRAVNGNDAAIANLRLFPKQNPLITRNTLLSDIHADCILAAGKPPAAAATPSRTAKSSRHSFVFSVFP